MVDTASELADRLRNFLQKASLSQAEFASRHALGEATIVRFLRGETSSRRTLYLIERALDRYERRSVVSDLKDDYGTHGIVACQAYLGWFQSIRPDYLDPGAIRSSLLHFFWNDDEKLLWFSEYYHLQKAPVTIDDIAQKGRVYVCQNNTGLVHLFSHFEGSARLITLTRIRDEIEEFRNSMYGIILSQFVLPSGSYQPGAAPLVLQRIQEADVQSMFASYIFRSDANDNRFPSLRAVLDLTEQRRVQFATMLRSQHQGNQ